VSSLLDRIENGAVSTKVSKNYRKPKREEVAKRMRNTQPEVDPIPWPEGNGCPIDECNYSSNSLFGLGGHVRMAHAMKATGNKKKRLLAIAKEIQSGNKAQSTPKANANRRKAKGQEPREENVRDLLRFREIDDLHIRRVGDQVWATAKIDGELYQGRLVLVSE